MSNNPINDPGEFQLLSRAEQDLLLEWISLAIGPASREDRYHTSYGLKHAFERDSGLYVTNGAFKGAMLARGIEPTPRTAGDINWCFKIKPTVRTADGGYGLGRIRPESLVRFEEFRAAARKGEDAPPGEPAPGTDSE